MDQLQTSSGFMPGLTSHFKKSSNNPQNAANSSSQEKSKASTDQSQNDDMRGPRKSPFLHRVPNRIRNHLIACVAEFVGTFMFLFLAFAGTQVANSAKSTSGDTSTTISQSPNPQVLLYISLAFGFSLAVNAWVFFRVSGGLFNPAVTLGLGLIGAVPLARCFFIFFAQMLGAMAAAGVVACLFPGPLAVTTSLNGATSQAQGLFIEMFLTAMLVFTIIMLAAEKHKGTFIAPIGIGLALFVCEMAGVYYTGGSLNPARSFGPCVANRSFPHEHWIYWIGPALGALLAAGFFWFIKSAEYETVNPGQDFDDLEAGVYDPERDGNRPVVQPTAEPPLSRPFSQDDSEPRSSSARPLSTGEFTGTDSAAHLKTTSSRG